VYETKKSIPPVKIASADCFHPSRVSSGQSSGIWKEQIMWSVDGIVPLLIRCALIRFCLIDGVVDILLTGLRWMSLQELFLKLMDGPKGNEE
jgi:hypothetical protein